MTGYVTFACYFTRKRFTKTRRSVADTKVQLLWTYPYIKSLRNHASIRHAENIPDGLSFSRTKLFPLLEIIPDQTIYS